MLTDPARAEPLDSGVGEWCTSMREMLFTENWSRLVTRPVPLPAALARSKPPMVMGTFAAGTPFIETFRASPAL